MDGEYLIKVGITQGDIEQMLYDRGIKINDTNLDKVLSDSSISWAIDRAQEELWNCLDEVIDILIEDGAFN